MSKGKEGYKEAQELMEKEREYQHLINEGYDETTAYNKTYGQNDNKKAGENNVKPNYSSDQNKNEREEVLEEKKINRSKSKSNTKTNSNTKVKDDKNQNEPEKQPKNESNQDSTSGYSGGGYSSGGYSEGGSSSGGYSGGVYIPPIPGVVPPTENPVPTYDQDEIMKDVFKDLETRQKEAINHSLKTIKEPEITEFMSKTDEEKIKALIGNKKPNKLTIEELEKNMTTIQVKLRTKKGDKTVELTVNKKLEKTYKAFFDEVYKECDDVTFSVETKSYVAPKKKKDGSLELTDNALGAAVDLKTDYDPNSKGEFNDEQWNALNVENKFTVAYKDTELMGIAEKYGLKWKGNYVDGQDSIHFSAIDKI